VALASKAVVILEAKVVAVSRTMMAKAILEAYQET
jgi:hypothetical protein